MRHSKVFFRVFLLIIPFSLFPYCSVQQDYDLVIKGGCVVDGSGNPWFHADIGIKNDTIRKIGRVDESRAAHTIDAQQLVIAPGFIDIHTHCDREILDAPAVANYINQGVTTVIGGNCGDHPYPLRELFREVEKQGIAPNFGCLVGHNTVRQKVMGYRMEAPTNNEMENMRDLVEEEMRIGALGFSTGLSYLPGIYSTTEEIVALASVAARYGGIYATHLRDQGLRITEAVEEAIEVGDKNSMPVQISHIKLAEEAVWGELERILRPVEEARQRGVEVSLDQYPYTATSSGFTSSFPSWAFEGGKEKFLERLQEKDIYKKIRDYIVQRRLVSVRGIDKPATIYIGRCVKNPEYEGKNLKEILFIKGKEPSAENAADLIIEIEKNGGASGVFFQMDERDVENLMKLPYTMHASDGGVQEPGEGVPHPRNYGTFPRVLGLYVRDKGIISLEDAVRKMTSLPAQTLRLGNRGMIREGMYADLVIFDRNTIKDRATFTEPHQYGQGIEYLIVNGKIVLARGKYSGLLPGKILYGEGRR